MRPYLPRSVGITGSIVPKIARKSGKTMPDIGRVERRKRGNGMPRLAKTSDSAPFQRIPAACRLTGLSQTYLRAGCKAGTIPHIMAGRTYLVNIPALLRQLGAEVGK